MKLKKESIKVAQIEASFDHSNGIYYGLSSFINEEVYVETSYERGDCMGLLKVQ